MKTKFFTVFFACIFLVLLSSCTSIQKPAHSSALTANLAPKEYEVLGEVVYKGSIKTVLGAFSWGNASYYELNKTAKEKYDADDVINISRDTTLKMFYIFYVERGYVFRGLAIKYK